MKRKLALLLLLLVSLACGSRPPAEAPGKHRDTPKVALPEVDRPLPLDARITHGKLDNGLTYYVLPHQKPQKRAQIWLAVNAGSVLEDDDQRGLAHFVEHMGFNGTRRFPKTQLVDFLEKSGVRFGADLNAYTSFDETVYMLQVPTEDAELFNRAFSVLRDWADGITFDPEEVKKERGVVLEEWRLGRGAGMRLFDKQAPVIFRGSKYAQRLPIGKPDIIKNASRETLLRFYRDWYRPDLMAVVAVGDFEPAGVVTRIEKEFASMKAPDEPRPRPKLSLPPHEKTLVSVETDPELPRTSVEILSKFPHRSELTARDYRRALAEQLFNAMLSARLDEVRRQPDAPFLQAASMTTGLTRSADVFRQSASVKEDAVERGFGALLEEVLRVERHGFTATELDRAKKALTSFFRQAVKERDKQDGREFAAEAVRHFLEGEAMPGREAELGLLERFLPTFSLTELNELGKKLSSGSRVIAVTGPTSMKKPAPTALLAVERQVAARDIQPYVDAAPNVQLMAQAPTPGKVAEERRIDELGVIEWKLENGVRVVVKPTDFQNDKVLMSAYSPGGHSLVKDADFVHARFAEIAVGQGGLGPFDAVALRKAMAGKLVSLQPQIGELEEGLIGQAAPDDLETLFQMIHLSFTAPRRDEPAFLAWQAREVEQLKNQRLSPERVFFEDILELSTQNHPRRAPLTAEMVKQVELDKALAIYKDRFADAGDFTFVFVGNLEPTRLQSLVETYLGSLPSTKRQEKWRDVGVRFPRGVKTKTVRMGQEPKAAVTLTFHGTARWSEDAENDLRMLGEALRFRLRQVLREDLGGVYGVQVGGNLSRRPRQEYTFGVRFGCDPEKVEALKQAVFDEIKAVQTNGVDSDYIDKIKQARRRYYEVAFKNNGFWLAELEDAYVHGDDPRKIVAVGPWIDKVSSDRVKAAAKTYLSQKQYVLGVLEPAKAP